MPEDQNDEEDNQKETAAQEAFKAAERLRVAEEAKIKAEAQLEAYKSAMAAAGQEKKTGEAVWTDEQWRNFEEQNPGVTRQSLVINQTLAKQQIDALESRFSEKVSEADKRAKAAEDRAARLEAERERDKVKQEYFKTKPVLARYEKDMDEFLSKFPEADRSDPVKLKELLPMAETYVKGKVGDKMKSAVGAPRFESGVEERGGGEGTEEDELDLSKVNPQQRAFMERVYPKVKARGKDLDSYASEDGRGIVIGAEKDFEDARKFLKERYPQSTTVI